MLFRCNCCVVVEASKRRSVETKRNVKIDFKKSDRNEKVKSNDIVDHSCAVMDSWLSFVIFCDGGCGAEIVVVVVVVFVVILSFFFSLLLLLILDDTSRDR